MTLLAIHTYIKRADTVACSHSALAEFSDSVWWVMAQQQMACKVRPGWVFRLAGLQLLLAESVECRTVGHISQLKVAPPPFWGPGRRRKPMNDNFYLPLPALDAPFVYEVVHTGVQGQLCGESLGLAGMDPLT